MFFRSFLLETPKVASIIRTLNPDFSCSISSIHLDADRCHIRDDLILLPQFLPRLGQYRSYTSKKHRKKSQDNYDPFQVLGLSKPRLASDDATESISYATVKRTFLQIAMKHHPDTSEATTPEEISKHREIFMAARKAFEAIVEVNGVAVLRSESEIHKDLDMTEHDFENWFQMETGHSMPFMDMKTMKEVAEMTETVGGGLDRDGGMWTLARMVTASVKSGGDGRDAILSIEAGAIRDPGIDGVLRRRKRR